MRGGGVGAKPERADSPARLAARGTPPLRGGESNFVSFIGEEGSFADQLPALNSRGGREQGERTEWFSSAVFSFAVIRDLVTLALDQSIAFCGVEVVPDHLRHQLLKSDPGFPAELRSCFGGIGEQGFHFGRAIVVRVDGDDAAAVGVVSLLVCA